jgi:hypothetical protein
MSERLRGLSGDPSLIIIVMNECELSRNAIQYTKTRNIQQC